MNAFEQQSQWETLVKDAQVEFRSGDLGNATDHLQQALDWSRKQFGDDSSHTAVILSELAECFEAQGNEDRAEECFAQVRDILKTQHSQLN